MTVATVYQSAPGFNNTGGLATLTPQPKTPGIKKPQFTIGGDLQGDYDGSKFVDLTFTGGGLQIPDWNTLLSQLSLSSQDSSENTFSLLSEDRLTWFHYNGIIYKPQLDWSFQLSSATFRIVALIKL